VLDADPAPLPQKGAQPPPQFSAHVYCGQTAGWIKNEQFLKGTSAHYRPFSAKMPLGMEVGFGSWHIVLDGEPSSPHFSAHVYCGQTARWIKMPLGTKVGLDPGHIVSHEDPASPPIRGTAPIFGHSRPSQPLLSTCSSVGWSVSL